MRVRIEMTVEVDPEVWATEYCLAADNKRAVADDVRNYYINSVHESPVGQLGGIQVIR